MTMDIGKKQTIEELTNGRIKKKPREERRPMAREKGYEKQERRGRTKR